MVFDELYWGDFGNYCRQFGLEHREIQRLIERVHNKAIIQLKNDGASNQIIDWQADTKYSLQNLSIEHREVIAYLTNEASHETMPIIWSLNQLANNPHIDGRVQNIKVPIILTMQNAINRFSADFAVRYNHE